MAGVFILKPLRFVWAAVTLLAACTRPVLPDGTPLLPLAAPSAAGSTAAASVAPPTPVAPAPTPTLALFAATPTAVPVGGPAQYTIVDGDTLLALAERFGVPVALLAAANPSVDPDLLFPGDVLVIPDPSQPLLGLTVEPGALGAQVKADVTLLNLRAAPNTQAKILAQLAPFTPLEVLGRTADSGWLQVITHLGRSEGWVASEFVDVLVALDEAPVISVAPLATVIVNLPVTAVPVTALPPGDYRYISGLSGRAREIFLTGQMLGNRANVFSKVGDSITVSPVFMSSIGQGYYNLRDYAALQPVIDFYFGAVARQDANSFSYTSLSAKVGWRARAVLSPASADPAFCQPDEGPLACEYRVVQPAVALIMLGTNDVPFTPEAEFEADMRRVLDLTLERGIIPVVSTIPPLFRTGLEGRAELLNGVLVRLAREYNVPLWDYWAALQGLPNTGMAGDGVHPSWAPAGHSADFTPEYLQYGMVVRNLTGLYVLDAVWRGAIQE